MKISCAQMDMRLGDEAYNYAHAEELIREAVGRDGADVVVLPETWNTGYFPEDLAAHKGRIFRAGEGIERQHRLRQRGQPAGRQVL